jgi:hypothetical protein
MQVPRTDVTVLDQRLPLRLSKRQPRRRELGRCRNSSIPAAALRLLRTECAANGVELAEHRRAGKRLDRLAVAMLAEQHFASEDAGAVLHVVQGATLVNDDCGARVRDRAEAWAFAGRRLRR